MLKKFDIIISLIIFVILVIYVACSKSTIIAEIDNKEEIEETYVPRTKTDSTEINDSTPIIFTVTVEGWNEIEINN